MTKNIVISGYYGFNNFGDEAILSTLVDHLRSQGMNVTVISNNPKETSKYYQVNSVKNFNMLSVLFAIANCDVLISGGGSLLQDATSFKSLMYYSTIIRIAQFFKKKVIIFAQGIGPLTRPKSQKIVKEVISKANYVTVRDSKSLDMVKRWGIHADEVSDPVYSFQIGEGTPEGIVGVQLRDYVTMNDTLLMKLAQQIVTDFSDRKIEIYAFQKEIDLNICKVFQKMLKQLNPQIKTEVFHSLPKNDFIYQISRCEYMIAMRYHALLIALKLGVKPLAINYDAKVTGLAYDAMIPLVTMEAKEDFGEAFDKMKALDRQKLLQFANSKTFDWSKIDQAIMS